MQLFGNDSEGFVVETEGRRVFLSARGFWGAELASQLVPALIPELDRHKGQFSLELDLTELRPLRDEGQAAFRTLFSEALARNFSQIYIRSASALTKLQMMRIARNLRQGHLIVVD